MRLALLLAPLHGLTVRHLAIAQIGLKGDAVLGRLLVGLKALRIDDFNYRVLPNLVPPHFGPLLSLAHGKLWPPLASFDPFAHSGPFDKSLLAR